MGQNRAKNGFEYSTINLGKRLCELKETCPHGTFTQIAEQYTGLTIRHCQNLMRIYETFGEKPTQVGFSTRVLVELTRSPEPEKLLEDCEPTITVKEAKEMVRQAKIEAAIEELTRIKDCPDLMHTQDGLDILYSVRNVAEDLIQWLEEKRRNLAGLHVVPGGE